MFNVGAKVKCIAGSGDLKRNAEYTVQKCIGIYVYLKEISGGWYHDRFEVVNDGRTSRTTDPVTSKGKRKVNKYEEAVLDTLAIQQAEFGYTGKDIAKITGHPLNCITPRFAPLRRKGLIKARTWGDGTIMKSDKQILWVLA